MRERSGGSTGPATSRPCGVRTAPGASVPRCSSNRWRARRAMDSTRRAITSRRSGRAGRAAAPRDAAEIELLLTDALVRYATEIRTGRRIPGYTEPDWAIVTPRFDAVATLTQALREPVSFAAVLAALPPPASDYRALVAALGRYRALAARGGWPAMPPGTFLNPGDEEGRVTGLRARLAAEDELVSRGADVRYDDLLAEAVRRFQARHGLAVDGIVGPATVQALNVPVTDRVRQIVLNLERWRWVPRELGRHHVVVNAADARLHVVVDGRPVLTSRVVVGDLRHPTPVVQAWVDAVVLHPRWNVPTSIAVEEILPRLRENRRYLAENDIVVLERRESDPFGLAIDWAAISGGTLSVPAAAAARARQPPGPDQARYPEPLRRVPARHADPGAVRAAGADRQPRMHPGGAGRRAGRPRAGGRGAGVDPAAAGRRRGRRRDAANSPHAAAPRVHTVLDGIRGAGRVGAVPGGRLRTRPAAGRRAG